MGWFTNNKKDAPAPAPLRRDKVMNMIKAGLDLEDAIDRDDDQAWQKAHDAGNKAYKGATKAEIRAAQEGVERGRDTRWLK
ncbi:hypothetical protein [Actinoallomurus iriomotensis]|uniref:Uncharacterized protein n=1 Tax=Actinoallomurus iriomotensis TaxID=478107 RepID=A0A9W6RUZ8_9ACTN|nr:hypothetical protein [Actinoallomurus iriomotensis]GLY82049.1 hypothetical protein Airi01_103160 [Actinoallomurus iriomotensis]